MIVAVDGVDGSGKATQTKLLAKTLRATRFSFPNYESKTGEEIRAHLAKTRAWADLGNYTYAINPRSDALVFQSLQIINRLELLPAIREAIRRGPVVFDRYWQSAYVYGGLDGIEQGWLDEVLCESIPLADINILLDIPVEESFRRRPDRRDHYEANREFLEKVRVEYLRLFRDRGRRENNWYIVDGTGAVPQVQERIMAIVG